MAEEWQQVTVDIRAYQVDCGACGESGCATRDSQLSIWFEAHRMPSITAVLIVMPGAILATWKPVIMRHTTSE